jgi:hypothetical protein
MLGIPLPQGVLAVRLTPNPPAVDAYTAAKKKD